MTDKQFSRRLAKLNSSLYDCICEAEELSDVTRLVEHLYKDE